MANEIIKDFLQEIKEQGTHNLIPSVGAMENKKFSDGEAINDWWFDMMVEGDEEPVRRILDELPEFRKEWDDFQFKREQKKKEIAAELEEEKRIARWMSEQRKHYAMGTLEKRYIDRLEALDWWSWRAEGDYYCHCGKQYNSKQGLKRHKKRKHKNPPPPPFYEEPIPLADEGGDILPPAYVEE
tara:strand:+ start:256 stop:807 length:552 start_codon:yes stop_codon:yes gene_type:complete